MTPRHTFTLSVPLDTDDELDARTSRWELDPSAPLPLGYPAVIDRAVQLRRKGGGWTWPVIAAVMGEYHGFWRAACWWAVEVKAIDPERRPRGNGLANLR